MPPPPPPPTLSPPQTNLVHEALVKRARADGNYDEGITILKGRMVRFDDDAPEEVCSFRELGEGDAKVEPGENPEAKPDPGNGPPKKKSKKEKRSAGKKKEKEDDEVVYTGRGGRTGDHVGNLVCWRGTCDMGTSWEEAIKLQAEAEQRTKKLREEEEDAVLSQGDGWGDRGGKAQYVSYAVAVATCALLDPRLPPKLAQTDMRSVAKQTKHQSAGSLTKKPRNCFYSKRYVG